MGGAAFRETADRRVGRLFRKHRTLKKPRFRFGFLSRLRPYWCFRAFLLRAFSFFFCHDVYLTSADATPKVRILGQRGRARGGLGVAMAKDRSSLPVSLKRRKKETASPHAPREAARRLFPSKRPKPVPGLAIGDLATRRSQMCLSGPSRR